MLKFNVFFDFGEKKVLIFAPNLGQFAQKAVRDYSNTPKKLCPFPDFDHKVTCSYETV